MQIIKITDLRVGGAPKDFAGMDAGGRGGRTLEVAGISGQTIDLMTGVDGLSWSPLVDASGSAVSFTADGIIALNNMGNLIQLQCSDDGADISGIVALIR